MEFKITFEAKLINPNYPHYPRSKTFTIVVDAETEDKAVAKVAAGIAASLELANED